MSIYGLYGSTINPILAKEVDIALIGNDHEIFDILNKADKFIHIYPFFLVSAFDIDEETGKIITDNLLIGQVIDGQNVWYNYDEFPR